MRDGLLVGHQSRDLVEGPDFWLAGGASCLGAAGRLSLRAKLCANRPSSRRICPATNIRFWALANCRAARSTLETGLRPRSRMGSSGSLRTSSSVARRLRLLSALAGAAGPAGSSGAAGCSARLRLLSTLPLAAGGAAGRPRLRLLAGSGYATVDAIDGSRGSGYPTVEAREGARERLRSRGVLMGIGVGSGRAGGGGGRSGGGGRAGGDVVATRLAPAGGGGGGGWPLEDATCGSSIFPFRNSRN